MYVMPLPFLLGTLAGLVSLGVLAGGAYIVWAWIVGELATMEWFATGIGMLLWSAFGRYLVLALYPRGSDEPGAIVRTGRKILAPDGSVLHVETEGAPDKPAVILTHGWGLDSTAWYYLRKQLSEKFHIVLWDLPGFGRSTPPYDGRYSVARLAEDLRRVIDDMSGRPVTLVGHSIGGMMILTLCRLHPDVLGRKVIGIVLVDSTHTWPLNSMAGGGLLRLLRWPLLEPLLLLTMWLSPLVWLMNLQSYASGFSHIAGRLALFSRDVTRGQLDFAVRFNIKDKPSLAAKGLRAMLRWDESRTPAHISVPVRVIAGDADLVALPDNAIRMSEMIRNADFVRISRAGHAGLIEKGPQYGEAVAQLVQRLMPASRVMSGK